MVFWNQYFGLNILHVFLSYMFSFAFKSKLSLYVLAWDLILGKYPLFLFIDNFTTIFLVFDGLHNFKWHSLINIKQISKEFTLPIRWNEIIFIPVFFGRSQTYSMHGSLLHCHIHLFQLNLDSNFFVCSKNPLLAPYHVKRIFSCLATLPSFFSNTQNTLSYLSIGGTYLFSIKSSTVCLAFLISPWRSTFSYWIACILLSRSVMACCNCVACQQS